MKKATIIHLEKVTQYFKEGVEVTPSAEEKLLNAIFNTMETETIEFKTELEVVTYKNEKELTDRARFAYPHRLLQHRTIHHG